MLTYFDGSPTIFIIGKEKYLFMEGKPMPEYSTS